MSDSKHTIALAVDYAPKFTRCQDCVFFRAVGGIVTTKRTTVGNTGQCLRHAPTIDGWPEILAFTSPLTGCGDGVAKETP